MKRLLAAARRSRSNSRIVSAVFHDAGAWTPEADARLRAMVHAAIRAGVDFVAIDEYELFAATLHEMRIR